MADLLRALSIRQPWAWLIIQGIKDIENRDWTTRFRGPVLIHAGKRLDDGFEDALDWPWHDIERPDDFAFGGIVGQAEIVDCVVASSSRWFCGRYGFVIRNARPLPFCPCRGMLGFFTPEFLALEHRAPKRSKSDPQASLFETPHV